MLGTIFAVFAACFVLEPAFNERAVERRLLDMLRFRDVHRDTSR